MKSSQIQRIKQKTAELIELKTAYNKLVADTDQEFSEKVEKLNENKIHIAMKLAKKCLSAIKENRSLLPRAIRQLEEILDSIEMESADSLHDERDHSDALQSDIASDDNDPLKSNDVLLSGDDDDLDLDGVTLDIDAYIKQYEPDEDLSLDSD